jgi:nucleoid-associated protein YgaU
VDLLPLQLAWWVGAVLLVWLSISLGVWTIALGRPRLEHSLLLRILTVPGSRRLVEGFLTVGMIAGCSSPSAPLTAPQIEVLGPVDSTARTQVDSLPAEVTSAVDLAPSAPASGPDRPEMVVADPDGPGGTSLGPITLPEADEQRRDDRPTTATHTVVRGDNLWVISEDHLSAHLGRPAWNTEIGPFWIDVIDANLASIRSGDPDLIYPGETIALPPMDVRGTEPPDQLLQGP